MLSSVMSDSCSCLPLICPVFVLKFYFHRTQPLAETNLMSSTLVKHSYWLPGWEERRDRGVEVKAWRCEAQEYKWKHKCVSFVFSEIEKKKSWLNWRISTWRSEGWEEANPFIQSYIHSYRAARDDGGVQRERERSNASRTSKLLHPLFDLQDTLWKWGEMYAPFYLLILFWGMPEKKRVTA